MANKKIKRVIMRFVGYDKKECTISCAAAEFETIIPILKEHLSKRGYDL